MIKFPSIEQYKNVIRAVSMRAEYAGRDENGEPIYNKGAPKPKLTFRGTVKLHGTNAGIVHDINGAGITYQSRERELSLTQDNAGFMLYMSQYEADIMKLFDDIYNRLGFTGFDENCPSLVLFGEWCGSGIQKGVAISELPKMFVIFGIKALTYNWEKELVKSEWLDLWSFRDVEAPDIRIFNIMNFPIWYQEIDFERPEIAQNEMIKITEAVEAECPVGKAFGVSGIGEGVVWQPVEEGWRSSDYWFKVKGEKHSVTKVKTIAPIDVEKLENQRAFIASVVTEARLEQGLHNLVHEQLKPFEMKSLGDFIRWVYNDVIKEEMDTIVANQYDPKKLGSPIADVARKWYINKFNSQ